MPNSALERLRKRLDFLNVAKTGERYVTPGFIVQVYLRAPNGPFRYGITATRKIGGAVERNRAKRRLRALIRQVLFQIGRPGLDYVFIARTEVLKRGYALMSQEFEQALIKLHKRVNL